MLSSFAGLYIGRLHGSRLASRVVGGSVSRLPARRPCCRRCRDSRGMWCGKCLQLRIGERSKGEAPFQQVPCGCSCMHMKASS